MNDLLSWKNRLTTTLSMELLAAVSGLALVGFIFGHLGGNFLLFLGPEAFNAYAEHLQALGPLLWLARGGLLAAAAAHISMTVWLKLRNRAARGGAAYAVSARAADRSVGTRTMIYTGVMIACFVLLHVCDFTLSDKAGPRSMVNGESLHLYGVVFNGFANPVRSLLYIVAVWAVGLHFTHVISSFWVTLGILSDRATRLVDRAARALGILVALSFTSIPVFILIKAHFLG